ncbi:hypothetical protein MSAN_01587900 [Mycena sanguinolenta]|uniref:Uncharacterized protein n=1 Tax=Mycena sanguinolenta TaxID=230812 RepID=A0A8H6Y356_9AGAR|nr:hypothetical protein MSAN_01587900 [Mycena sanguinolenta]
MALQQYPLVKTFIVAAWLEVQIFHRLWTKLDQFLGPQAILYGIYFCGFWVGVYLNIRTKWANNQNRIIYLTSIIMFIVATLHVCKDPFPAQPLDLTRSPKAMNGFRVIVGYVDYGSAPGGPVSFLGVLSTWHHIFKDSLYAFQSILGDAMAVRILFLTVVRYETVSHKVYRCWVLWNRRYVVAVVPFCLLIASTISGITVTVLFGSVNPNASIFDPRLAHWITVFYSVAVAQNMITTGLMVLRLWTIDKQSARIRVGGSSVFMPLLLILVESAALYLFVEILLLALYAANYNAQYILLESITPVIGITFGMIALRLSLRPQRAPLSDDLDQATVGSMALRRIAVNVTTHMEHDIPEDKSAPVRLL